MRFQGWTLIFSLLVLVFTSELVAADSLPRHEASAEEFSEALKQNQSLSRTQSLNADLKPVVDTADFSYVLLTATGIFSHKEIQNLRKLIAQNLPAGVKLVVLTPALLAPSTLS
jgi:hypothetical protein